MIHKILYISYLFFISHFSFDAANITKFFLPMQIFNIFGQGTPPKSNHFKCSLQGQSPKARMLNLLLSM